MDKGLGEESPGFRISDLAKKVLNVDGRMLGKDGKPLVARRNIIHNTDLGSKLHSDGVIPSVETKDIGHDNTSSTSSMPTSVSQVSGKRTEQDVNASSASNVSKNGGEAANASFASVVKTDTPKAKLNFRKVESSAGPNGEYEAMIPLSSVKEVASRLHNSIYGYFIGKRIAFPVVENYVRNAWGKFGIQKVMMNAKGFYFFKFASAKGVDDVLENGPWMIRTVPIILNKWSPAVCLTKENHETVPVWIKIHDVPIAAFTADGLSVIASKVGKPLMMDAYTCSMCEESWGRSSYARVMIEICAKDVLKEEVKVAIPNLDEDGYVCETSKIEYEWRPPHCKECKIFGHATDACPKLVKPTVSKNKEKINENADGFQQVKGKNQFKNQRFKSKSKFEYRPVINKGKQKEGEGTSMSNKFGALDSTEASEFFDSKGDGETVGNVKKTAVSDGSTWKVSTSGDVNNDEFNSADKLKPLNKEDDSDGDDVENVYEDPEVPVDSQRTNNPGASTPVIEVSNV